MWTTPYRPHVILSYLMKNTTSQTNQTTTHPQVDIWETWSWLWQAIFYISILLSFIFTLVDPPQGASGILIFVLTSILLLWHWVGLRVAYAQLEVWSQHASRRMIILVGDIVIWFVLVNISASYYFMLFGLFIQVFQHLPTKPAVTTALFLTGAMLLEQVRDSLFGNEPLNVGLGVFLLVTLGSILVGFWMSAIIDQSTRRRLLIEQLETTRAELAETERRAGALEERQRLTHEIHDTLAQGFTSILIHLEAAEQVPVAQPNIRQQYLDQVRITARDSLNESRRFIHKLRPELLDQRSLLDAIQRFTQQWQSATGIPVTLQSTGTPVTLHATIEINLLRATQEALANVNKHAQATEVQVTLSYFNDQIMLDVQDDGIGMAGVQDAVFDGGFGLQAMRERIAQCHGTVEIESSAGDGTIVVITIPLLDKS